MSELDIKTIYNPYIGSSGAIQQKTGGCAQSGTEDKPSFKDVLEEKLCGAELKFSKHAQQRIDSRQVTLTIPLMEKLSNAVSQAKAKGIEDALIISDEALFIVNTASNTVVTTVNNDDSKERIFTNINGTVII